MKRNIRMITLALCSLIIFGSCAKDNEGDHEPEASIATIVATNPDFSLLEAAVIRAGLLETLSAEGTLTVFAPDNGSFEAAGLGTEAAINAVPVEDLKRIILYHVLGQEYPADDIPMGTTALSTANNLKVFVTKNDKGVFVNGVQVKTADIMASNGVIHAIGKVLMPPSGNIVEVAQSNSNLSFLVAAVVRASAGSTDVAAVLSGAGPYTVFAPTNEAFMNAGFATIADIQAADPNTLAGILTYHVVAGRVFSSDLSDGLMPETLNGEKVTITLSGGAKVKGNGNTSAANIILTDIVTTNGVVHVIDGVLLP